jgi:hypothetical protein
VSSTPSTPRRGPRWSYAVLLIALLTPLLGPAPAAAQEPGTVSLTVSGFTGTLGPGSVQPPVTAPDAPPAEIPDPPTELVVRALIEHTGGVPLDQLRLVVEVQPAATTRGGLRAALDTEDGGGAPASVHEADVRPDEDLRAGEVTGLEVRIPDDEVAWADGGGVHPVRISVVRGAEILAETRTAVVWLSSLPEAPLLTTALWPLDTAPWRGPGAAYPSDVDTALRPGGRLDALLRSLERFPDTEVLLAPSTHLLEDLRDRADGFVRTRRTDSGVLESLAVDPESTASRRANEVLQRVRTVVGELPNPPLSRPYADADLAALTGPEGIREVAGELATTGRRRLQQLVERAPDQTSFLLSAATSPEVLDLVPAETVLVPYEAVEGPDPEADPTLPSPVREVRSASGRPVRLLVGDPYVSDLLATPRAGGSVLSSQRILAESAMAYFEAPGSAGRAFAVHPPEAWAPSAELAGQLLEGLAAATWLDLRDPASVAAEAAEVGRATLADDATPTLSSGQITRLADTLEDLAAASAARTDDPRLDGREAGELRDQLLRSTSRWFPAGSGEADALVGDVAGTIDATLADVRIASGSLVTLTSDTGTIPVTLQRGTGGPIAVRVEVASQGRLAWPDGRQSEPLLLEEGTTQTVSFATRALSTGTFSVTVRVTDPSGRLELDRTTLSVRSTAISGFALLSIGIVVLLLLAAGLVRRRPRRSRRDEDDRPPLELVR